MAVTTGNSDFLTFQRQTLDKSPQDVRAYWTPQRKNAAIPAHRTNMGVMGTNAPDELDTPPDAANAAPTTEPQQADLSKMPFITGGKLFFTLDGVDYVASGNIFMKNNLLLTAAHCVQDDNTGHLAENFVFERCYTGELSTEDFTFRTVALKENWYTEKDNKWDYAIAILNRDSTVEKPLQYRKENLVGKTVTASGYPTDIFDGAQMMYITGTVSERADSWIIRGGKLSNGASGGAWVLEDGETVVGLNSFGGTTAKGGAYLGSPKFDAEFDKLYNYVLTLL